MARKNLRNDLGGGEFIWIDADKDMHFVPMLDRVLVKPRRTKEKTEGGIFIPETAKRNETIGIVVAVGHGRINSSGEFVDDKLAYNIGDVVIFGEFTGTKIFLGPEKEEHRLIYEHDIYGIAVKVDKNATESE